ncbi:MAG: acyl-CoA dehydrogenase family protein [Alphaproteobacteria bacterium]|nr:acyl-CoA dehydrogenase family protein [Alphaproteobacteria bacterium]
MDLAQPLPFNFKLATLPPEAERLRGEVRSFLASEVQAFAPELRAQSWSGFNPEFSRKLGARGFIGITWPKAYGGHERSALERYVVVEELLAAGAPVAAHWVADRQSGPLLLKFGTEEQRRRVLPGIAKGETYFAIGMSEPDSGSDLASVRTRATRTNDGWRVKGTKLWSSWAHKAQYMIALFRTGEGADQRQMGLTQFLVDMSNPGIKVRPIADLTGHEHFNEVVFDDALLPHDAIIGAEGQGWAQVTAELAYERSGPERFLSSMMLLKHLVAAAGPNPSERVAIALGRLTARLHALRTLSVSVAMQLQAGANPALEAALVKDVGAVFEQDIPEVAHELFGFEPSGQAEDAMLRIQAQLTQAAPSFSLRGGTREILRGIIARGLGLR